MQQRTLKYAARIPALEQDFALDVFNRLHVMEMKPAFAQATVGRREDELYMMAKTMLGMPDTSMKDHIEAEQAAERLRDGSPITTSVMMRC